MRRSSLGHPARSRESWGRGEELSKLFPWMRAKLIPISQRNSRLARTAPDPGRMRGRRCMSLQRRQFLQTGGALAFTGAARVSTESAAAAEERPPRNYRLGMVTYNIAARWDIPAILRVCKAVGISPVEMRTTHAHGVEPSLTKEQRKEIRKRFADAGIEIWGCGTVCEFHSPDAAVVQKNIETCKAFIELAADIGGRGVK